MQPGPASAAERGAVRRGRFLDEKENRHDLCLWAQTSDKCLSNVHQLHLQQLFLREKTDRASHPSKLKKCYASLLANVIIFISPISPLSPLSNEKNY